MPDAPNNPGLVSDCEALLAARDTLSGTKLLNWSPNTPINSWEGVELGGSPTRVKRLVLYREAPYKFDGEIPPELGELSALSELVLHWHFLSGEIPAELGNLSNLSRLELDNNHLTGEIPPELGNLSNLSRLHLDGNDLSGDIPPELGNLSKLTVLDLKFNELRSMPPELGNLSRLTRLILHSNQLTGEIPSWLGNLSRLTKLDLGYNRLAGGIPSELANLSSLDLLILSGNGLTGEGLTGEIPPWLGGLTGLTILWLDNNGLTGQIPPELGNLSNLTNLTLKNNQFTGCIPDELRDVSKNDLEDLSLALLWSEYERITDGGLKQPPCLGGFRRLGWPSIPQRHLLIGAALWACAIQFLSKRWLADRGHLTVWSPNTLGSCEKKRSNIGGMTSSRNVWWLQ